MSSTFVADPTRPSPTPPSAGPITDIASVLQITSLNANGGQPSRISNLNHANVAANVNRSAQNAVANQQAHSQLTISVLGKTVTRVQNLGPLEARSSVDVLSNNEVAQAIADLSASLDAFSGGGGGGGGGGKIPTSLWQLIKRLIHQINRRLEGDGSLKHPFKIVDGGPIFSDAPVTFAFPGLAAGSVSFTTTKQAVNVVPPLG